MGRRLLLRGSARGGARRPRPCPGACLEPPARPDDPPEANLSDTVILLGPGSDPAAEAPAVSVRLQVIGTNGTTLRAKAWLDREPTGWTVQAADSTGGLQRPGAIGVQAVRGGGSGPGTLAVLDVVGRVAP